MGIRSLVTPESVLNDYDENLIFLILFYFNLQKMQETKTPASLIK